MIQFDFRIFFQMGGLKNPPTSNTMANSYEAHHCPLKKAFASGLSFPWVFFIAGEVWGLIAGRPRQESQEMG